MIETDTVHVMDFQHPMKNLSQNGTSRREPEAEFSDQFAASYREKFLQIHRGTNKSQALFVREVPVASFGIADLLVLSWKNSPRKIKTIEDFIQLKPQTRAFEVKLSDWRNGLMQAHRYRYFSNVSILVLPAQKLRTAEKHIEFFKKSALVSGDLNLLQKQ